MIHEDSVFHSFRLSLVDRRIGSLPIATIQLRHVFFEEAALEFLDLLQAELISPILLQQPIVMYEFVDRLRNFFAEGATITMDSNLQYYTPADLHEFLHHFEPSLHFAFFCPSHESSHQMTIDTVLSQEEYLPVLRHVQLLQ